MGAIGEDGVRVINDEVVRPGPGHRRRARRRSRRGSGPSSSGGAGRFRGGRPRDPAGRAGGRGRRRRHRHRVDGPGRVPGGPRRGRRPGRARRAGRARRTGPSGSAGAADEVVCLDTPEPFFAVGQFYADFTQTTDDEVVACLTRRRSARRRQPRAPRARRSAGPRRGGRRAGRRGAGSAAISPCPTRRTGVVLFAHGSGSSRHSPRNRYVAARACNAAGLATLLFDLLHRREELDRANVFDIDLLAPAPRRRHPLAAPAARHRRPAASATSAPAPAPPRRSGRPPSPGTDVAAVVSRGGRPDLAGPRLADVTRAHAAHRRRRRPRRARAQPRRRRRQLRCENRLAVVPGATHLFEEPGTLQVARTGQRLVPRPSRPPRHPVDLVTDCSRAVIKWFRRQRLHRRASPVTSLP